MEALAKDSTTIISEACWLPEQLCLQQRSATRPTSSSCMFSEIFGRGLLWQSLVVPDKNF